MGTLCLAIETTNHQAQSRYSGSPRLHLPALDAFHANKHVFIDLEIRKHFRINKIHKLKHYTDSRGTADGYNTENTERLHIDLAKVGYKATNKKAYTYQMTWAVPGYIAEPASADEAEPEGEDDEEVETVPPEPSSQVPEDSDDEGELDVPHNPSTSMPVYTVAKTPGFPNVTVASLSTDFHAPDFLRNLKDFLDSKSITATTQPSQMIVTSHVVLDKIRAVKSEQGRVTAKGFKPAKAGRFDTVLVRTGSPVEGESPTSGLRVARVRTIFRLPEQCGNYAHPLVYIDWFKPLTQPVADIGMYQVSLSSRNLRQNSEIISITDIVHSCHLVPVFGRSIDPTWTS
ncbi:hypothetical protein B0H14DRAFT_2568622 [Mycena olivaceomarginata]|nr:hypothetical protein B0H14DRAFT_2568622 [Mycena olivaceomarginata]